MSSPHLKTRALSPLWTQVSWPVPVAMSLPIPPDLGSAGGPPAGSVSSPSDAELFLAALPQLPWPLHSQAPSCLGGQATHQVPLPF